MYLCVYLNVAMCRHKAAYALTKYVSVFDKKIHISSLGRKKKTIARWLNPTNYMQSELISECRMASFRGMNSEIQGCIFIVGGDFFFAPALKWTLVLTHSPGTGLAKLFESACPKLSINLKKNLSSPRGNLKSKLRSWSLP